MAQGDVVAFDQFAFNLCSGVGHNFGATPNTLKCAIVNSVITPTETTINPCWGPGGDTDFSLQEVAIAGDYVAGGNVCATPSVILTNGAADIDFDTRYFTYLCDSVAKVLVT